MLSFIRGSPSKATITLPSSESSITSPSSPEFKARTLHALDNKLLTRSPTVKHVKVAKCGDADLETTSGIHVASTAGTECCGGVGRGGGDADLETILLVMPPSGGSTDMLASSFNDNTWPHTHTRHVLCCKVRRENTLFSRRENSFSVLLNWTQ